jgi:hypothetical protein
VRQPLDLSDSNYSLTCSVADTSIAQSMPVAGQRWNLSLEGRATGHTSMTLSLLYNGSTELASGAIPVIVRNAQSANDDYNFMIKKSGVWHAVARHHAFVDTLCGTVIPNKFVVGAGQLTDLYSFRQPQLADSCNGDSPSGSLYRLVFEFADAGVSRAIHHPVHWGEYMIFHIEGLAVGATSVRIHYIRRADYTVVFTTPPIPVEIT